MTTHFAVTERSIAAWARSFDIVATNDIVGGHPTTFVIRKLYCCPGQAIWATQVMPRCIDHLLKCLEIPRWASFHFDRWISDLDSKKQKETKDRYRFIDCTIYMHHQYSSIIINVNNNKLSIMHQSLSIINYQSSIILNHQSSNMHLYFILFTYWLVYINIHSYLLHQTFAWRFQVPWPSDEFIRIPRELNIFLQDIHHQQLLPLEAQQHLDLDHTP